MSTSGTWSETETDEDDTCVPCTFLTTFQDSLGYTHAYECTPDNESRCYTLYANTDFVICKLNGKPSACIAGSSTLPESRLIFETRPQKMGDWMERTDHVHVPTECPLVIVPINRNGKLLMQFTGDDVDDQLDYTDGLTNAVEDMGWERTHWRRFMYKLFRMKCNINTAVDPDSTSFLSLECGYAGGIQSLNALGETWKHPCVSVNLIIEYLEKLENNIRPRKQPYLSYSDSCALSAYTFRVICMRVCPNAMKFMNQNVIRDTNSKYMELLTYIYTIYQQLWSAIVSMSTMDNGQCTPTLMYGWNLCVDDGDNVISTVVKMIDGVSETDAKSDLHTRLCLRQVDRNKKKRKR